MMVAVRKAIAPQTGKVRIHVVTTSRATPQHTADSRFDAPTPIILVLKGIPKREASSIHVAVPVLAAKPW